MESLSFLATHFDLLKNKVDIAAQQHLLNPSNRHQNDSQVLSNQAEIIQVITAYETQSFSAGSLFQTVYFASQEQFDFPYSPDQFGFLICIDDDFFPPHALQNISFNFTVNTPKATNESIRLTLLASRLLTVSKTPTTSSIIRLRLNASHQTSLSLRSMNVSSLEPNSLTGLCRLRTVDLSFNRLLNVDRCLFNGLEKTLTSLDLSRNQLLTQICSFQGLDSLETLNLSFLQISNVHADAFSDLVRLQQLYLSHNYSLSKLGKGVFNSLSRLATLDLSNCELPWLDRDVFSALKSLESLSIGGNQFESLPTGVFNGLVNLRSLDASSNLITSLPECLFNDLTSLAVINLSNNCLRSLVPKTFSRLTKLSSLLLSDNRLTKLDSNLLKGLVNLRVVDLSFNQISSLSVKSLQDLVELRIFKLNDNFVRLIEVGLFEGLSRLTEVDLANNRLTELDAGVFAGLGMLGVLNLFGNEILQVAGLRETVHVNWNKTYTN